MLNGSRTKLSFTGSPLLVSLVVRTMIYMVVLFFLALDANTQPLFGDVQVTYGSAIILRHVASKHKLFSTKITWGFGSKQQIVTGVIEPHFDENTFWLVKPKHSKGVGGAIHTLRPLDEGGEFDNSTIAAGSPVKCNHIIRLEHMETEKNLHSHRQNAAISEGNFEVCGFGKQGSGDTGDDFQIECVKNEATWRIDAPIMLRHIDTNGVLVTSKKFMFSQSNCPRCPIVGHQEISVQLGKSWKPELSHWRAESGLSLERHDEPETRKKDEL